MSKQRILRLRGLPWSVGEDEVRKFLQLGAGHEVFIRRRGELSTGEAYVEMASHEEAAELQTAYNREMLGGRYIEIFLADATDMEELKDRIREQDKGWVVRLRGLPFKATQEDVLEFFRGIEILNGLNGITLIYGRDGRPLGEAYVELHDEESQTKALHLDRERMGPRYIEVFKSTKADLNVRLQSARKNEGLRRQSWPGHGLGIDPQVALAGSNAGVVMVPYATVPSQAGGNTNTLKLINLPNDTSELDIAQYFADLGVMPGSIQLSSSNAHGFTPKTALVAFASAAHAEAARQQCQRQYFKDHQIQAFPAPAQPAGQAAMPAYQQPGIPMNMSGVWAYPPPATYMYDDLSKLIRPKSPAPVPRPMPNLVGPYTGMLPGQSPFGAPLLPQSGSPSFAPRQAPSSPSQGVPFMGQARAFSPGPMPVMRPASPVSMSQQQMILQQQQQLFLMHQQQQQFLMQQSARFNPVQWNMPPQHAQAPTPFSSQQSRPSQAQQPRNIGPPRMNDTPSAGPSLAPPSVNRGQLQAPSMTQQASQGPLTIGDLLQQPSSDLLSRQASPQTQLSLHPSSQDSLPPLAQIRAGSGSGRLPSQSLSTRQHPTGHDAFRQGSSGDLSQRQSDPVVQNLSLASLHLSDRAPSARSHAASSTTASAPSGDIWAGTNLRAGSQNMGSQNMGSQNMGSQNLGSQNLGSQNLGSQHLPDVQY